MSEFISSIVEFEKQNLKEKEWFRDIWINSTTGDTTKEGELIKMPKLAKTLRKIATYRSELIYNGEMTDQVVKEMRDDGF